ncbi:MAG TPA: hypothetical protein VF756_22505 [Thermoanaerobaculia bacterium]
MIPTLYKSRLPGHLSYPIGAQALSAALAGAPHAEALTVAFSEHAVVSALDFQRLLRTRQPYRILRAEHEPARRPGISASNQMVEKGWYDEKWEIRVFPVLRELRHLANRLLKEEGLPAVAQWLRSSQQKGWDSRQQWIELVFDPSGETITVHEGGSVA